MKHCSNQSDRLHCRKPELSAKRLYGVAFVFVVVYALQPVALFAEAVQAKGPSLVAQEIRYQLPEAGEVFFVWGINGWQVVPGEQQPAGTVVPDRVMHTPMVQKGNVFTAKVWIPAGTTLDYGFFVTKTRSGTWVGIWDADGERDYHATIGQAGVIELRGSPSAVTQMTKIRLQPLQLGFMLLVVWGIVYVVFVLSRHLMLAAGSSLQFLNTIQSFTWRNRIVLVGIGSFVLFVTAINPDLYLWEDNAHYIIVGKSIATGEGLRDINHPGHPPFKYPIPMFPLFLAPIIYFFDYNLWPMKIAMALIGVGAVYLTYRFFKDLLDETQVMLLTLLVAVSPQIVSFSHQVMTEIPYLLLSLLALLCVRKYAVEEEWLTRMGLVSALVMTATCLTKSIGISVVLAAISHLLWDSTIPKLQTFKKLCLLVLVSGATWLLFNYSILNVAPYTGEFLRASPFSSDTRLATFQDFAMRISTNVNDYLEAVPETILYLTYKTPMRMVTLVSVFILACGFIYSLFRKRTILEYYLLSYMAILLVYETINIGNLQRYLVPIIPVILYYFIQGLNQITLSVSDLLNPPLAHSQSGNSSPAVKRAFRPDRTASLTLIWTLILFNCVSTVRASVLRTEPEMFDYGLSKGYKAYKTMALWTKEHTPPESIIVTRRTFLYHVWSHRTDTWYPYVNAQSDREQIVDLLKAKRADYVALDTLDFETTGYDQSIMDVVQQSPESFQLVYQDGNNKLYRIRQHDGNQSTIAKPTK